jgi:hypothetical protein
VCSYTCEGPNHAAPLSFVQLDVFFLYFPFVCKFVGLIVLCFPGPSETVRGSNFYYSCVFFCTLFYPLFLCDKNGE